MEDEFVPLTNEEDLKYQLQTLVSYTGEDLDYPEMEVAYENKGGTEGFLTIDLIDLGKRALQRIEELERKLKI